MSKQLYPGHTTHGMNGTKTHNAWKAMKQRIDNPNTKGYHRYGGRGISYDPQWTDFENFYADMGECPPELTLERLDSNGNYCKENCKWATPLEQSRNTSKSTPPEVIEKIISMWANCKNKSEIARSCGVTSSTVGKILRKRGYTKARPHKWYTEDEKTYMLSEYKSGRSVKSISKELGRCNKGVARYLDSIGARN